MTPARYYVARHGLIWTICNGSVRTLTEAEGALEQLGRMACDARSDHLSQTYIQQTADLVAAIREARSQVANDGAPDLSKGIAA